MTDWIEDMFKKIDANDLEGAKSYLADDFEIYFAHYELIGPDQFFKFVSVFDKVLRIPPHH